MITTTTLRRRKAEVVQNRSYSRAQRHDLNLDPTSPPLSHSRHNFLETLLSICHPRFGVLKWRSRYSDGARLA